MTEDAPRIRRLVADLDSDQFSVRDAAWKELEKMDAAAHAVLRQEVAKAASLEQRRRIQALLMEPWLVQCAGETTANCAVMVLEQIGRRGAAHVATPGWGNGGSSANPRSQNVVATSPSPQPVKDGDW